MLVKPLWLMAAAVMLAICTNPLQADAAQDWYTCTVLKVGPVSEGTTTYIQLTDTASPPAFVEKYFRFVGERAKEMLAVALTAVSSGLKVLIRADASEEFAYIDVIYLTNE